MPSSWRHTKRNCRTILIKCAAAAHRKQGTMVRFTAKEDHKALDKLHFMCKHCKQALRHDAMAPRCILNGLQTMPVPEELSKLDCLGKQLVQRAKSAFYLPLPLERTLQTLDEVDGSLAANPELYIIVNNKPTNSNKVWRNLVNVRRPSKSSNRPTGCTKPSTKTPLTNWPREIIEVVSSASSTMLEKASDEDISGLHSYTIMDMNDKLSTEKDLEQYKLLNVKEDPLDCHQKHLDAMCFPMLFPDGMYGENNPRILRLSNSEYIKSRIWNDDSRFRKDPQYIFYLLTLHWLVILR